MYSNKFVLRPPLSDFKNCTRLVVWKTFKKLRLRLKHKTDCVRTRCMLKTLLKTLSAWYYSLSVRRFMKTDFFFCSKIQNKTIHRVCASLGFKGRIFKISLNHVFSFLSTGLTNCTWTRFSRGSFKGSAASDIIIIITIENDVKKKIVYKKRSFSKYCEVKTDTTMTILYCMKVIKMFARNSVVQFFEKREWNLSSTI